ncbi:MAG: outer membrane beta-barrel protein, partial [Pseudomonadota bacterium]
MIWRSPQQRDRATSVRRLAMGLAVCCALPCSSLFATQSAQAQDANGAADALPELRRGLDGDVPLVDENLDGIDDRQQPDVVRPRQSVTFDTPIDNSANDGADPDRTNDASRNRRARDAAGSSNTTTNGGGRQGQAGRLGRDPALNRGQLTGSTQTQQQAREDGNSRARRAQPVGAPGVDGEITPLANQRVAPIERTRTPAEADPYAVIGIRTGTFDWFPTLTQTFGYTSNADASAGGQGSAFSQTDAAVSVRSNWALHELRGEASLGYQTFFSDANNRVPTLNLSGAYRHDLAQDLLIRIAASYGLTTESPSSDNLL